MCAERLEWLQLDGFYVIIIYGLLLWRIPLDCFL